MRNPFIVDLREPLRRQKCSQDKPFPYAFVGRRSRPFTLRLQLLRQPLPLLGLPLLRPLLLLRRRRLRLLLRLLLRLQPLLLRLRLPRLGLRLMQLLLLRLLPPLLRLQLLLWQQLLQRSECGMLRGLLRLRLLRMLMLILSRVGTQGLSIFSGGWVRGWDPGVIDSPSQPAGPPRMSMSLPKEENAFSEGDDPSPKRGNPPLEEEGPASEGDDPPSEEDTSPSEEGNPLSNMVPMWSDPVRQQQ